MAYFYYGQRSHRRRVLGGSYDDKVLSYSPIAYWPLWETSGTVAECLTNVAMNGSYTGVTLGQAVTDANGVSFICPFFDGTNDFVNIATDTFRTAFQTAAQAGEFSIMAWARVNGAANWTDGTENEIIRILVNGTNFVYIRKATGNNTAQIEYNGGGTFDGISNSPYSNINWFNVITTFSLSGNAFKGFWDGTQAGGTQIGLGTWAGLPNAATTLIGATTTGPLFVWHGWLAKIAIWNRALTAPEIANLAVAS